MRAPAKTTTRRTGPDARRIRRRRAAQSSPVSRTAVLLVLGLSAFYFLLPVWWLVVAATKEAGHQFSGTGLWFERFDLWANVDQLVEYEGGIFLRWMGNSLLYSGVGATIGTLLSALAGFALAKFEFRGREAIFTVVLAAVLIPKIMFTLPLFLMFSATGVVNTYLAVLLPSVVSPFGVYLARIFAAGLVPDEVIEAARLDGTGELRIFFRIGLPMMTPALVTIFLFQFVEIWNNYLLPAMVLSDRSLQPVTVGLVTWNSMLGRVPYHLIVTGALLSVVPLIVAFLSLQRFWRSGLSTGAIK